MKASSQARYLERIDRVVARLESSIASAGPLPSVPELAREANLSEFHFMRVYRALAAESLGATIQRLRMSRAAYLLSHSESPVAEIAVEVGFETPQAFAKAMRQELGMSPSEVRERYRARPSEISMPAQSPRDATASISVQVVELQPFRVLALRNRGAYRDLNAAYARLFAWLSEHELTSRVQGVWGVPYHDRRDTPPSECIFDCCVAVLGDAQVSEEIMSLQLGGGRYLTHCHVGAYERLEEAHDALLRDSLPDFALELRDSPILHQFLNDPDDTAETQLETIIHVPVK